MNEGEKIAVGVQLWTLREECQRDIWGTLEKIAQVGYRWIEPYSLYGIDAHEFARVLKDMGLKVVSSHVDFDALVNGLDRVMADHEELECHTIVCPWLDESRRAGPEAFEKVGRTLHTIGGKLRTRGYVFLYHNHDFEFKLASNPDGLQRILGQGDPRNLAIQLDTYWVSHAGFNPVDYLKGIAGRVRSIHLKDGNPAEGTFAPVGQGKLDMPSIIAAGRELGVRNFIVEQDIHYKMTAIESIRLSLEYLREQGLTG
ncbi:sugar phosphate isomerase/epimerase [Candidatus Sumerlaeota bacterium]|nr:sugar phosphate isomerase/epimerase [Candidatus Sumerlaeota bacterium]